MKPVLIVKTGSTVPGVRARRGDFEDWIAAGLALEGASGVSGSEVVAVHEGDRLPAPASLAAIVVTGSSAMVSDREAWSERTARWLASVVEAEVPTLGICYGHQLLAHGCGGRVGPNPNGREIGSVVVEIEVAALADDPLLAALAAPSVFQTTHVESVLELPPGARRVGRTAADPNHVYLLGRSAWGVQFHPEFDADVMRGYLQERRDVLAGEGLDADVLIAAVRDTPEGPALLARFGAYAASRAGRASETSRTSQTSR